MKARNLIDIAESLLADEKGLLAMDESNLTCDKRFARLGIPQTVQTRRAYRELIVTTPNLGECIGGAILCDETIRRARKTARFSSKSSRRQGSSSASRSMPAPRISRGIGERK